MTGPTHTRKSNNNTHSDAGSHQECCILLVEQNIGEALGMATRGYVFERGRVIKTGQGQSLLADPDVQHAYLGL